MLRTVILLFLFSCARAPLEDINKALIKVDTQIEISDDMNFEGLQIGIKQSIEILKKEDTKFGNFQFGEKIIPKEDYLKSLTELSKVIQSKNKNEIENYIKEKFDVYKVYGRDKEGEILLTSYFTPVIKGSFKKTGIYTQPLYALPQDLIEINLEDFSESEDYTLEFESKNKKLIGRFIEDRNHKRMFSMVPYYSREEIDIETKLPNKLILCYVEPVDAFFLQIQGSGVVEFANRKKITMVYAGQNGRKYIPIGKFLLDEIPLEEMSMEKIEDYLHGLDTEKKYEFMAKNPSYVFFDKHNGLPKTTLGTDVVSGRTIATDLKFFPKGALAFLEVETKGIKRLVLDHDTGGAIYGGGRADLFWGMGKEAKKEAGSLREFAKLYYLAPK